ncbi:hypothetical protein [Alteromonas stellipolaris]|uniref:hypothetical protein n=1 Tax=Alteromonas stellipolaris TaxID=233316 RepID=UPI0030FC5DE8
MKVITYPAKAGIAKYGNGLEALTHRRHLYTALIHDTYNQYLYSALINNTRVTQVG